MWEALAALRDPKAPRELRVRGLRLYAFFLFLLHGATLGLVLLLPPVGPYAFLLLPFAAYPWALARRAEKEGGPLGPALVVGAYGALGLFLGVVLGLADLRGGLPLVLGIYLYGVHKAQERIQRTTG